MDEKSICLIIPYFGRWPKWFDYFLTSCKKNPSINWLIFSDIKKPDDTPENVIFVDMGFEDFKDLISKKIGFTVSFTDYNKICDFRPAFGLIFEKYLKNYDFWGHTDLDNIYGDLRGFLSDDLLGKCDVISTLDEFINGSLSIFKNRPEVNHFFRKNPDFEKVFKDEVHFAFDEVGRIWENPGIWDILKKGRSIYDIDSPIETFSQTLRNLSEGNSINVNFLALADRSSVFGWEQLGMDLIWKEGRLFKKHDGKELMFFHFSQLKNLPEFKIYERGNDENFRINRYGIRPLRNSGLGLFLRKTYWRLNYLFKKKIDY